MRFVNRFLELAKSYPDKSIPLEKIFEGASVSESEQIIDAMYAIADRRIRSGTPISIEELSSSIPDLVTDSSIMDAAIEISILGMTESGCTRDQAIHIISETQSSKITESMINESESITTILQNAICRINPILKDLPSLFGRPDNDGQARYELRRIIGCGNQGTVYEAVDRVFADEGEPSFVAVKIYHNADVKPSMKEGARARRVRHKNVASVIDQGQSAGGEYYVTYELIEGRSFDEWVKHRTTPLRQREACQLVIDIARGIQSAHAVGVIHRDIKPSNILINRMNEPIITDFGIAHTDSTDPRLCSQYGTRGSLAFMAPEQYDGSSDGAMPSVDIYAIGGILYWLLFDKYANGNTVSDAITWLEKRSQGGPHRLKRWDIDERLKSILTRALSVDPADRYQSAESFAQDLESYLAFMPIPWLEEPLHTKAVHFAKRNPIVVALNIAVMVLVGVSIWIRVDSMADIRFENAQSQNSLEIEKLNSQVAFEQERVEQVKEKSRLVQVLVESWSGVLNGSGGEDYTASNLLFLYMVSTSGLLADDPEYTEKILNRRIDVAKDYLASIDQETASPIRLALWHETIGSWYENNDDEQSKFHYKEAASLVQEYASGDTVWLESLLRAGM